MPTLERLTVRHAAALLQFELENRAYFAKSISDRGDAYFARFGEDLAERLAEQEAGVCLFHVVADEAGAVIGRFNLFDVADGSADLGFRVAQRVAGRGVATSGVRQIIALARDEYGLRRLFASAALDNPGSLAVLRATGFVPVGDVMLPGRPGLRHERSLAP